jgi:TonB family protein
VLDFSGDAFAPAITEDLSRSFLAIGGEVSEVNRDMARAAARGAGYAGSLNLTLDEARDLGRSIGCDFYFAGRAETLRRSPSNDAAYFEAYAAVFLVSTRTGRLVMFDFVSAEDPLVDEAQRALRRKLTESAARYRVDLFRAHEDQEIARARLLTAVEGGDRLTLITDAPGEEEPSSELRLPQPFRRVRPPYTELAARAAIEATVDVGVEIKASGEVGDVEVQRWAGFGLDEAVMRIVREMHFRPAIELKTNKAVPLRVLLRYNFRRPVAQRQ